MRLGDLDSLKSEFEWLLSQVSESSKDEVREVIKRIDKAPTVDAVPVVRCKECVSWKEFGGEDTGWGNCQLFDIIRESDEHCSDGERRNDESKKETRCD